LTNFQVSIFGKVQKLSCKFKYHSNPFKPATKNSKNHFPILLQYSAQPTKQPIQISFYFHSKPKTHSAISAGAQGNAATT
jgi:hypothetical protein